MSLIPFSPYPVRLDWVAVAFSSCSPRMPTPVGRRFGRIEVGKVVKPQVFITDTGHQTENIVWLGGILGLFLLALLTLIRPGPTTGSVVMYYGLVVIVSLLLASVFRKNSFFREYVVDESQVVEITSFWKRMHWRKCYPRQDVSRRSVLLPRWISCRSYVARHHHPARRESTAPGDIRRPA